MSRATPLVTLFLAGSIACRVAAFAADPDPAAPREASTASAATLRDAGAPEQLFTEANRLFNGAKSEADVRRAAENYRTLLEKGIRNGRILYNLGCLHLRLREWGPAILALRRSLAYLPSDPYTEASLAFARKQVVDDFRAAEAGGALQTLFFWHRETSFGARFWTFLALHALFWTLFAWGRLRPFPLHRAATALLFLASALLAGSLLFEAYGSKGEEGVIVAPEADVRSGNGPAFDLALARPVHSGVEVKILETRGSWSLIEFPNAARCWLIANGVELVRN